jgi:hypothetical protein
MADRRDPMDALVWLLRHRPDVDVTHIAWQSEHDLVATDVLSGEESVITTLPQGSWVCVDFADGERFAIWKHTGDVYQLDAQGAVRENPVLFDQDAEPA